MQGREWFNSGTMTQHPKKDVLEMSIKRIAMKALHALLVAILMGAVYIMTPIISFILLHALRADPYAPPIYHPYILYAVVATVGSLAVGIAGLRSIAKAKWTASLAAPIIAFTLFYTCLITLIIIYGTQFPVQLIVTTCLVFFVALICSTILLDMIGRYAYIFAILFLAAFGFWLPGFIHGGALDLKVDYQAGEVTKVTQSTFQAYSPKYVPWEYKLERAEEMSYKNVSYILVYDTDNIFSPFNPNRKSFSIRVDSSADINLPAVCDYEETDGIKSTRRPVSCEKMADTKSCTVYVRHLEPFVGEKRTNYFCKVGGTNLKMATDNEELTQDEVIKIFDSLRPGISRPN